MCRQCWASPQVGLQVRSCELSILLAELRTKEGSTLRYVQNWKIVRILE